MAKEYCELTDIFCQNESGAELLTNRTVKTLEDAIGSGRILIKKGVKKVLMTLGAKGCLFVTVNSFKHVSGVEFKPLDTTEAGDYFIGSFAFVLAARLKDEEAARSACVVASISVQKPGIHTKLRYKWH